MRKTKYWTTKPLFLRLNQQTCQSNYPQRRNQPTCQSTFPQSTQTMLVRFANPTICLTVINKPVNSNFVVAPSPSLSVQMIIPGAPSMAAHLAIPCRPPICSCTITANFWPAIPPAPVLVVVPKLSTHSNKPVACTSWFRVAQMVELNAWVRRRSSVHRRMMTTYK